MIQKTYFKGKRGRCCGLSVRCPSARVFEQLVPKCQFPELHCFQSAGACRKWVLPGGSLSLGQDLKSFIAQLLPVLGYRYNVASDSCFCLHAFCVFMSPLKLQTKISPSSCLNLLCSYNCVCTTRPSRTLYSYRILGIKHCP